jgi:hypothetical protein
MTILLFLISTLCNAQSQEKKFITYAQNINVCDLDSTLSKQRFEDWLKSLVGPKVTTEWEVNDCGEHTGIAGDSNNLNLPSCVQVTLNLVDGRLVGIQLIVGTMKTEIKGIPAVLDIYIEDKGKFRSVSKLRNLPELIKK